MKVAVITRHAITNYGSLLQAMATQKVIEDLGHSCKIIDYVRSDESYRQYVKTLLKRKTEWNNSILKKIIYLVIRQPESIVAGKRFEKAQQEYLNLTTRYKNPIELKESPPEADIYVTGSDQVWGPIANGSYDDSYCLSFITGRKVAYAASFGHVDMNSELCAYYKKWLMQYEHIAVREDSAVQILAEFGIAASQVLDPTLLLDANCWTKYLKAIKHRKYVLVYQLHNDPKLGKYAEKVAKAKKLPLIRISTSFHQITRQGKFVWCPSLGEFLSYIKNAECLITDSFHGTAFAINFNTSFIEVLPNNNTGTRNMSILRLTNLSDRILRDENDIELANKKVDFQYANKIIEEQRRYSVHILKSCLME